MTKRVLPKRTALTRALVALVLLLPSLVIPAVLQAQGAVTSVASDDFESGNHMGGSGWWGPWVFNAASVVFTGSPRSSSYHVQVGQFGTASRPVNLAGQTGAHLQFWAKLQGFQPGDTARVEVSPNCAPQWSAVVEWTDASSDGVYRFYDRYLDPYPMTSGFCVQFVGGGSSASSVFIDDVAIVLIPAPTPTPEPTATPAPVTPTATPAPTTATGGSGDGLTPTVTPTPTTATGGSGDGLAPTVTRTPTTATGGSGDGLTPTATPTPTTSTGGGDEAALTPTAMPPSEDTPGLPPKPVSPFLIVAWPMAILAVIGGTTLFLMRQHG